MRSHTLALLLTGLTLPATAATDSYSTGPGQGGPDQLCDVWQSIFNGWGLLTTGDEDFDGCSNLVESVAGTDPRKAGDCHRVGNMVISATNIVFTFDSEAGKKYRVLSDDSPGGAFTTVVTQVAPVNGQTSFIPTTDNPNQTISVAKAAGARKFYKLEVSDADSDGDGVSDWAERETGTDPNNGTSLANASGGTATDGAVMASLLSLAVAPVTGEESAFEKEGSAARLRLTRVGTMQLNGIPLAFAGDTDTTKGSAVAGDYNLKDQNNVPLTNTVSIPSGAATFDILVNPTGAGNTNGDGINEVPETLKVTCSLPGIPGGAGPSGAVKIKDATVVDANRRLFVAYLGREAGVTSTASGIATALVNGDNDAAAVSITFSNLSSPQTGNDTYIRISSDLEVKQVPDGQVSGASWPIRAAQFKITDQAMLTALFSGEVYLEIRSDDYPTGEIKGYFNLATGSTTFNSGNPDLVAPTLGSANWTNPTGEALEREIWRFMSQCTWGGTQAMYNDILAEVNTAVGGGGTYITGLSNWLDKQMNPALTPSVNFRTLVMAADNEDFMLRGNKPITPTADPQFNGTTGYGVTYNSSGMPVISATADTNISGGNYPQSGPNRRREWWGIMLQGKDQVRQRFTQALSEITVISEADQTLLDHHYGTANYWDMLAENAFGKYRLLLEKVTYSPMMGIYLSHMGNRSEYDAGGGVFVKPDENYAREIMQLFSIGLILRHPDGSLVLGTDGLPIPTYDQADIVELAKVMTGWSHGARHAAAYTSSWNGTVWNHGNNQPVSAEIQFNGESTSNSWFGRQDGHLYWDAPWINPMKIIGRIGATVYHDFGEKILLSGKAGETTVAAQTITGMTDAQTHAAAITDMTIAHNCLAGDPASNLSYNGHQNTPVNISRWLIQRLVTSNPSAGYVYRVSEKYRTTNGNLGQVLKSILLDYEARSLELADSSISHGKVKEPLVAFAATMRALRAFSGAPISTLKDNPPPFTAMDSPMPSAYPATEYAKFSTDNANPPALPLGWAQGPFRYRWNDLTGVIGQSPQRPPSVFNWFLPDYVVPGAMAQAGLYAPEMQIATESSEVAKINHFYNYTWNMNLTGMSTQPGQDSQMSDFQLFNNWATPAAMFMVNGVRSNTLTFTPADYATDQIVTVTAFNNFSLSTMTNGVLRFTVGGGGYDNSAPQPLALAVSENEKPNEGVLVVPSGLNTWAQEGGKTDTVAVRLSAPPMTGATVTINAATTGTQATVSPASYDFTSADWNTDKIFTVTAINDAVTEAAGTNGDTLSLTTVSAAGAYNGLTIPAVPVGVVDNDDGASSYGVVISDAVGLVVAETGNTSGTGTASYTIKLAKAPTSGTVTVTITAGSGLQVNTTSGGTTFGTTGTRAFTSGNFGTAQTVVVRGNDDTTHEQGFQANPMHAAMITHSVNTQGGYTSSMPVQPVFAAIDDNDNRVIMTHVTPTSTIGSIVADGETRVKEGGSVTDKIAVRLRTLPTTNVYVNMGSNSVICEPAMLTFTPANYNVDQLVTVTAADDAKREGLQSGWTGNILPVNATATGQVAMTVGSIAVTAAGTGYTSAPAVAISGGGGTGATATAVVAGGVVTAVNVTAIGSGYTSTPVVAFSGGGGSGAAATAIVPSGPAGTLSTVTVTNAGAGYTGVPTMTISGGGATANASAIAQVSSAGTISGITVNSGGAGYTSAPTVTVGTPPACEAVIIANANSEGLTDGNYNNYWSLIYTSMNVTILDNDNAGVTVTQSGGATTPAEQGATDDLTFVLNQEPTANVTVTLIPTTQFTVNPATITFTPANWNTPQVVTVGAVNDTTVEGDLPAILSYVVDSSDPAYDGVQMLPTTITVIDNDVVPVTVTHTNVFTGVAEGGTAGTGGTPNVSDTFTVSLPRVPTANVTVTLIPDAQVTVSPSSLTFTATNSTTAQTVTVTAVDDAVGEATPHFGTVRFAISSADASYNNNAHIPVVIPIKDNDNPGFSIVESGGNSTPTEGGTDTYTVVLTKQPAAGQNVVIDVASASAPDLLVSSSATFTGGATTNTSTTATCANTAGMLPGMVISGTGIPTGTTIASVTNGTTFVLSAAATATNTSLTFTLVSPAAATAVLTFTNANWNTTQTVTTTAIADMLTEGREAINVTNTINAAGTTDDTFDGLPVQTAINFITEQHRRNESLVVIPSGGSIRSGDATPTGGNTYVTEGDPATDSVDFYLSNPPQFPVTVTLSANAQMGFNQSTFVFTPANWNVPQTVVVSPIDDLVNDTYAVINGVVTAVAQSQNITFTCTAGDAEFFGVSTTSAVNILDNESPAVKIIQSGGITNTTEGGATDSYDVVLTKAPNGNVVVRCTAASGSTLSSTVLTFTPANWNVPQTVTVTATNDSTVEGNHQANITHAIRTATVQYLTNCATTNLTTTVTCNSTVGLVAGMFVVGPGIPAGATVASVSTANTTTFTLSANANATGSGVSLSAFGTTPDSAGAVVVLANGATTNGSATVTCTSTTGVTAGMALVGPGIPVNASVDSVTNATTLVLSTAATATASGLSLGAIAATTDTSGYVLPLTNCATTSASITVTCDSTVGLAVGMAITGTGVPSGATVAAVTNPTTFTLSAAASATNTGLGLRAAIVGIQTVVNNINDNDNRVIITPTLTDTRVHEDGTVSDTYSVVMRTQPTANVTITPAITGGFAAQGLSISPATLTFTGGAGGNWATPQTFTLTGVDNAINAERARTVTITHTSASTDTNFNAQTIHSVGVSMLSKDDLRILLIDNPSVNENGNTSTYRVALNRAPTADVNIALSADAQLQVAPPVLPGGALIYGPSANLTFTSANWMNFQTVTVRAVDDLIFEPSPHVGLVTQTATSADANYNGAPAGIALATITDNESVSIRVAPSGGSTVISEAGQTDTYDVVLSQAPTADVTVSVASDSQSGVSSNLLTFTSANWNVPQTVTITAVNDAAVENAHTSVITHGNAVSADANFNNLPVPGVTASVIDNDGNQLVITETGGSTAVVEGGGTDTFSIRLTQPPTGNVTVTLVAPNIIIPTPPYAKQFGYYTSDVAGGNQNRERVVLDFTEVILLYRSIFYGSLAVAYGGRGNIPSLPSDVNLQKAHWAATKAVVDRMDLWWCGGSLKAKYTSLFEPNVAPPSPVPAANPRQVILDCIYQLNGGANSLGTTRYLPEITFDPKNPPTGTFHDEVRDRCRWAAYLMSTVAPAFVAH